MNQNFDHFSNMNNNNLLFSVNNQLFNSLNLTKQLQHQSQMKYNIDFLNNLMNNNNTYNMQLSNNFSGFQQQNSNKYKVEYLNSMFNHYNYGSIDSNNLNQLNYYKMNENLNNNSSKKNNKKSRFRPLVNGAQSSLNPSSDLILSNYDKSDKFQNVSLSEQSASELVFNNSNLKKLDSLEEKLATTGNIFQKRQDWSIINKLPVNKQNTIHMRLEDEGPFGNDEIRCFVLSHFSSLGLKQIPCVFCDCNLIIYDRFPLIDGTLFLSPISYDPKRSVPTKSSLNDKNLINCKPSDLANKAKCQYINAICMKCITGERDHDIICKYCKSTWQSKGGTTLQIGTLYKYDIFASFPCCQPRLDCLKCSTHIINADSACYEYFSAFSDEKECQKCKARAYHFVKNLDDIYLRSKCSNNN